jgi:hypothetical protein
MSLVLNYKVHLVLFLLCFFQNDDWLSYAEFCLVRVIIRTTAADKGRQSFPHGCSSSLGLLDGIKRPLNCKGDCITKHWAMQLIRHWPGQYWQDGHYRRHTYIVDTFKC